MKNPIKMRETTLSRMAHEGRYPFCQSCGCEVTAGMLVHRRNVTHPGGSKVTNYFCDTCERTGRMYAVGKGKED